MWNIISHPAFWAVVILLTLSYYQTPKKHIGLPSLLDRRIAVKLSEGWGFFIPFTEKKWFSTERKTNHFNFYGEKKIDTISGAVEAEGDIASSLNKDMTGQQLKYLDEKTTSDGFSSIYEMIAASLEGFLHVILHETLLSKNKEEIKELMDHGETNKTYRESLLKLLQNTADNHFGENVILVEWTNFRMNPSAPILAAKEQIAANEELANAKDIIAKAALKVARRNSGVDEETGIPTEKDKILAYKLFNVPGIDYNINEHIITVPNEIKITGLEGAAEGLGKLTKGIEKLVGGDENGSEKDKGGE